MNALLLTVFVSLMLAAGAVLFFAWGWSKGDHQHADRLALLPLEDDREPDAGPRPDDPAPALFTPSPEEVHR